MRRVSIAVALAAFCTQALAGPQCTSEPKDKWMSEAGMRAKAVDLGYSIKVFKTTTGNCYEIYGQDKAGKRVEVYFHPVTGSIVAQHGS